MNCIFIVLFMCLCENTNVICGSYTSIYICVFLVCCHFSWLGPAPLVPINSTVGSDILDNSVLMVLWLNGEKCRQAGPKIVRKAFLNSGAH